MERFVTKGRGPNRRVIHLKGRTKNVKKWHKRCRLGYHWANGRCVRNPLKMHTTRIERTTRYGWDKGPVATKEKKVVEEIKDG